MSYIGHTKRRRGRAIPKRATLTGHAISSIISHAIAEIVPRGYAIESGHRERLYPVIESLLLDAGIDVGHINIRAVDGGRTEFYVEFGPYTFTTVRPEID